MAETKVFDLVRREMRREGDDREGEFWFIDAPDWVNVVALTDDDELVLIRQWRHAREAITLEIPGGTVDAGESPEEAARRELLEETGYEARQWARLGVIEPNPAILTNRCHTWLALGATKVAEPDFEGNEHCVTELRPWADAMKLVKEGAITHALVVVALTYEMLRRAEPDAG
ncbi:MAG: NUDIX hydrolase [Planctomycetota bacterium]